MKSRWEDLKSYDPALSPQGWAWEFLRRNADYRREWKKYDSLCRRYGSFEEAERNAPAREAWECDPPARPGETLDEWDARLSGSPREAPSVRSAIAKRWGLLVPPGDPDEPGTSKTEFRFFLSTLTLRHTAGWRSSGTPLRLEEDQIAIIFELADPIRPQVARAGKFLRETQKWRQSDRGLVARIDTPKYSATKLIEYLRILDARADGATTHQIVSTLYAKKDNSYPAHAGRKALAVAEKVALRLRDGGYRDLVQLKMQRRREKNSKR